MSIKLNPDDLQVTSFASAPGGEVQAAATNSRGGTCDASMCQLCQWTVVDCGTDDGFCTSPGYNC